MTDAPRRPRGRPPVPPEQRRDLAHRVALVPSAVERAELDAWAARKGEPLGRLILDTALRAARR